MNKRINRRQLGEIAAFLLEELEAQEQGFEAEGEEEAFSRRGEGGLRQFYRAGGFFKPHKRRQADFFENVDVAEPNERRVLREYSEGRGFGHWETQTGRASATYEAAGEIQKMQRNVEGFSEQRPRRQSSAAITGRELSEFYRCDARRYDGGFERY